MPLAIPTGFGRGEYFIPPASSSTSGGTTMGDDSTGRTQVIDGTPARVAVLGLGAAALLVALRWSGIRFNVAVSS